VLHNEKLRRLFSICRHVQLFEQPRLVLLRANMSSTKTNETVETATVAAGCFWSVELAYQRLEGVLKTGVGYIGGTTTNPNYKAVCSGSTGHAEAVQVQFNPAVISYEKLLDVFWKKHDPTQADGQGNDKGSQYRSAIFYHSDAQKEIAEKSKAALQKTKSAPIVTEITLASHFYPAEEYHQQYLEKGGQCSRKGTTTPIRCYV